MRVSSVAAIVCTVAAFGLSAADAPFAAERSEISLLKAPSRDAIIKGEKAEPARIHAWAGAFIQAKEKRANVELEALKKKMIAEEEERVATEKDRQRRQEKYNQNFGNIGASGSRSAQKGRIRMNLDFQVPELETYRAVIETLRLQQALATDIGQVLSLLDRDGDGKLSGDEYRDAGAMALSTARAFQKLDANADGFITEDEIVLARGIPASAQSAIRSGRSAASAIGYKIKNHDTDGNGVLDLNERKAMATVFTDLSIRLGQEADFYKSLVEAIILAREPVAAKFADIEVVP
ncbi:MAG TPA: hypothetical protein VEK08_26595 [Planctomycetota bacterium]|nr:hypothetical protein [Planctomycetota bacterium]